MDTADPRDSETGGGLSTEKQNITSVMLVCVCMCTRVHAHQGEAADMALI